jgi:predicted signal transduction protein with EAL and GGDEF domain
MVAERLRSCVRPADTAARLGGDEFAVLLEDIRSADDAAKVAERVLDALAMPFIVGGRETTIGASIGIALNTRTDDIDSLLRSADVAMYSVKETGRARYQLYATEMLTSVVDRVELGQQLRHAVENQELILHYQPMVDMGTGEIQGVEALIRWAHPTRGLLAPAEFLGVAEQTGAIFAIGEWVLDSACRQVREWNAKFPKSTLRVSVNLSPTQILQAGIVEVVSSALARSGLDPSLLVLELTEAVMVQDTDLAATRLGQLKSLGVGLAIDDFGTGYSSLSYLRQLPFDILKIDKGFIDGVTQGETEPALTRAILHLANALNMITVAEGVEEAAQAGVLQDLGCRFAQGYLFARPLPVDQFEALLASAPNVPVHNSARR